MLTFPVAKRLQYARLTAGLSQQRLAALIGTDRLHVLKWERGDFNPSDRFHYPEKLAKATGFPEDWFRQDGGLEEEDAA